MSNLTGNSADIVESDNLSFGTIFTIIVLICGFAFNLLSVVSLGLHSGNVKKKTIPITIMTQLIWCDFIAVLVYALRRGIQDQLKSFGDVFFCNVFGVTNIFFSLLSGLFAMFMACERYCALAMPFRYRRCFTMQKTLLTSLSLTIFAVLVSCLPILGLGSYELSGFEDNNTYCKLFWKPDEPPLYTLQFTIYFSASMILTTVVVGCNIGLTLELFRMRRKIADLTQGQHVAKGHEIKFVWTVMVITLAFLSCWLPWVVSINSLTK